MISHKRFFCFFPLTFKRILVITVNGMLTQFESEILNQTYKKNIQNFYDNRNAMYTFDVVNEHQNPFVTSKADAFVHEQLKIGHYGDVKKGY